MTACEHCDEQLLDHVALADDALGHLIRDISVRFAKPLNRLEIVGFGHEDGSMFNLQLV